MSQATEQTIARRAEDDPEIPCANPIRAKGSAIDVTEDAALEAAYKKAWKSAKKGCALRHCEDDGKCRYIQTSSEQDDIVEVYDEDNDVIRYRATVTSIGKCRCPGEE